MLANSSPMEGAKSHVAMSISDRVALDVLFFGKKRPGSAMEIDDEQLLLDSRRGPRRRTECRGLANYGAEQNIEDKARR